MHSRWRWVAALGLGGALGGGLVALAAHVLGPQQARDFGWYAYSGSPRRYVDYLPSRTPGTDWAVLLATAAVVGLVAGLLVAGAFAVAGRRLVIVRAPRRSG
jgi:hypothetical protein